MHIIGCVWLELYTKRNYIWAYVNKKKVQYYCYCFSITLWKNFCNSCFQRCEKFEHILVSTYQLFNVGSGPLNCPNSATGQIRTIVLKRQAFDVWERHFTHLIQGHGRTPKPLHSVHTACVYVSYDTRQLTEINSLISIDRLSFVAEIKCVSCVIRD
jgi:hypothetical protein